jgi:RNA polymerase sigma-70 factor (ECF subfamily)
MTGTAMLIERARAGCKSAWGELLHAELPGLLRLAGFLLQRKLRGKESASDLVQWTLVAAQARQSQFHGATAHELGKWLRGILKRTALQAARRFGAAKRDVGKETREPTLPPVDDGSSAFERVARKEVHERVAIAMRELPAETQRIIRMRVEDDLSFPDIAREIEGTEDSVRMQFRRALKKLGKALRPLA